MDRRSPSGESLTLEQVEADIEAYEALLSGGGGAGESALHQLATGGAAHDEPAAAAAPRAPAGGRPRPRAGASAGAPAGGSLLTEDERRLGASAESAGLSGAVAAWADLAADADRGGGGDALAGEGAGDAAGSEGGGRAALPPAPLPAHEEQLLRRLSDSLSPLSLLRDPSRSMADRVDDRSLPQAVLVEEILKGMPPDRAPDELAGYVDPDVSAGGAGPRARAPSPPPPQSRQDAGGLPERAEMTMQALAADVASGLEERAGGAPPARSRSPGRRVAARSKSPGRRKSVAQEMVEQEEAELTFEPNARGRERGRSTSAERRRISKARLDELAAPRLDDGRALARRALEVEEREMRECTFAPATRRPAESEWEGARAGGVGVGAGGDLGGAEEPAWERLHRQTLQAQRAAEVHASSELRALEECTFEPSISAVSARIAEEASVAAGAQRVPLHERLEEVQRERAEAAARTREAVLQEQGEELTFEPRLNEVSLRIAEALVEDSAGGAPAAEGSERGGVGAQRSRAAEEALRAADAELTFQPQVNAVSEALVASKGMPAFHERQARFERRRATRRMLARCTEPRGCTFEPELCRADEVLRRRRPDRLRETGDDKVERLSRGDAVAAAAAREAAAAEYMAQYTFEPRLCRRSREIVGRDRAAGREGGRARTSEDRAAVDRAAAGDGADACGPRRRRRPGSAPRPLSSTSAAAVAAARRASEERECTFQPKLEGGAAAERRRAAAVLKRPASAAAAFRRPAEHVQCVAAAAAAREAKLAECKRLLESAELRECTFAPRMALSARLKEEKAARERKAFSQPSRPGASLPARRGATAEAAARDREMGECTFKPRTRAAERRELVRKLLMGPAMGGEAGAPRAGEGAAAGGGGEERVCDDKNTSGCCV
eukprot:PRCOL_00001853-RA